MVSGERDETESNAPSAFSLARILRTLKRRGSNLLVVGLTSEEGRGRVCRRMLGDDTAGPRRRLLVITGADPEAVADRARRAQRPPPETTRYVTYAAGCRSASAERCSGEETNGGRNETEGSNETEGTLSGRRHVEGGQLTALGEVIEAEIEAIETESGGLAPAELRVCLDSLTPLLDAHDRGAVIEFLDRVTTRIKAVHGMGHVHLPVARDWEAVEHIKEPFDAVVELRVEQGRTQQRWHLQDADVTSDWIEV